MKAEPAARPAPGAGRVAEPRDERAAAEQGGRRKRANDFVCRGLNLFSHRRAAQAPAWDARAEIPESAVRDPHWVAESVED
jgi:hypothetical protein